MKYYNILDSDDVESSGSLLKEKFNDTVLIYGAGNFGKSVFDKLKSKGIRIIGFLDHKAKPGDFWNGTPVFKPEWNGITENQKSKITVVIAIHNRDVELPPILNSLYMEGYRTFINPIELYDCFSEDLGNRFWLTSRDNYKFWQSEIDDCNNLWNDSKSRNIYRSLIKFRTQGNYEDLPAPDLQRQYFPKDIPNWETPLRFVDCGAYDGDTIRSIFSYKIPIEAVAAFEPDIDNFYKLSKTVRTNQIENAALWPCGVYSSTKQLTFSTDQGEASSISTSGNSVIQCVSLDDSIFSFHPNLIKMDIEGAEMDALMGAKDLIHKYRPGLAISVYHQPRHLWQIPQLVNKWNLGYQLFLRLHGQNGFDTILYAIPGEL